MHRTIVLGAGSGVPGDNGLNPRAVAPWARGDRIRLISRGLGLHRSHDARSQNSYGPNHCLLCGQRLLRPNELKAESIHGPQTTFLRLDSEGSLPVTAYTSNFRAPMKFPARRRDSASLLVTVSVTADCLLRSE